MAKVHIKFIPLESGIDITNKDFVKESKEFATHQIDLPDLTDEEIEIYNQKFFGKYLKNKE